MSSCRWPAGISTSLGEHPGQVRGRWHPVLPICPYTPQDRSGCVRAVVVLAKTRDGRHERQSTPRASWSSPGPAADFIAADSDFSTARTPTRSKPNAPEGRKGKQAAVSGRNATDLSRGPPVLPGLNRRPRRARVVGGNYSLSASLPFSCASRCAVFSGHGDETFSVCLALRSLLRLEPEALGLVKVYFGLAADTLVLAAGHVDRQTAARRACREPWVPWAPRWCGCHQQAHRSASWPTRPPATPSAAPT